MVASTYQDQYTIVQPFKENAIQKVYIGTDNKNNQAVVINVIDVKEEDFTWNALEYTYQNIFQHVLHFEKAGDKVILVTKVEEGPLEAMGSSKKFTPIMALGAAGLILAISLGFFLLKGILPLNSNLPVDANRNPNQITETEDLEDATEGEDASLETSGEGPVGPTDQVSFLSEHVEKDFSSAKYGDYSFKISGENSSSHKLIVDSGYTKANAQLLMWLKLDRPDEIKIRVEGYSKDQRTFQQSIQHKPLRTHSWELVQLTLNGEIGDAVHIVFDDVDGLVWIDKISIDIFK